MKLRDVAEYRRRNPHRVPFDPVIGYPEPLKPGFVIQYEGWNFVVETELTREQFMAILRENQRDADVVTGEADLKGSRLNVDTARDATEPGAQYRYFYQLRRLR